ncbi:hypothetical protein [Clostridium botulinum]|uniref:hypothetical protein n=1 Tax=Clostridium botulinum TaxID=1491 RepID=UPI001FAF5958|nr:hypothetical protein [Clostridium botulinum]
MHSIESDVKFPDMNHYDINKPGMMALYLAHCDFYPFRSVIENNKLALDAVAKGYRDIARKASEVDDFQTECWAMRNATLHSCRVDLLTQYSLLLTMVSLLEEAVNTLCRIYHDVNQITKELKDVEGSGLERATKYIKEDVKIEGFKSGKWEYITAIRDARNMIVHNGGRVVKESDFKKLDKFFIGYRDEDKQIYLEYTDIVKMYDAIMEFMDKSFRLIPNI